MSIDSPPTRGEQRDRNRELYLLSVIAASLALPRLTERLDRIDWILDADDLYRDDEGEGGVKPLRAEDKTKLREQRKLILEEVHRAERALKIPEGTPR